MEEKKQTYGDEFDLIEIIRVIWNGKIIISFIAISIAVLGYIYSSTKPPLFQVMTNLQDGKPSSFVNYMPINEVLKENELLLTDENMNGYLINSQTIFKIFIDEFNDYQEVVDSLKGLNFVKQKLKELNEKEKERLLIKYAKSFKIQLPTNNSNILKLQFRWHNIEEGSEIFDNALQSTLKNVKLTLLNDIDRLADTIELKNKRQLDTLSNELKLILEQQEQKNKSRIQYLSEQSAIAKELGIETNMLDANALSQTTVVSGVSLNISPNEVPFYLRGFKAIDKEISLIKNRSDEEQLLMAKGYLKIKESILFLENDLSARHLRDYLIYINEANQNNWISYDLSLADSRSLNRPITYIAFSFIIGAIIGVIYVLIFNALRVRAKKI